MRSSFQKTRKRGAFALITILYCVVSARSAPAQTITVHLLNAKSGKPMAKESITVLWQRNDATVVSIDARGIGTFGVPKGESEFMLMGGPKVGEEPYRIAYINCNEAANRTIPVAQVIQRGVAPTNTCGSASFDLRPGEIVFWALPKPWWRPDFQ